MQWSDIMVIELHSQHALTQPFADYQDGYATGGVPPKGYKRTTPLPGYDRLTASKTNFSLGQQGPHFATASREQFSNPHSRCPAQQPVIGPGAKCLGVP